jgi:hypothetical protein
MERPYLLRYGLMRQVGRFSSSVPLERGQVVVIRSHRGSELGAVLTEVSWSRSDPSPSSPNPARVLRAANPEDLERARQADLDRPRRFALCQRVFQDGVWPLELIDVESLLDDQRTVLLYLGPHRLDASGLIAALRASCQLDGVLEPIGRDVPEFEEDIPAEDRNRHCGDHCGAGGCGTGGGCSRDSDTSSSGCSDCGLKALLKTRRVAPAR